MNIVITGSTEGIGYYLAIGFLKAGHGVLINGRNRLKCAEIYAKLNSQYPESLLHIYACDVTCYNSVERMYWEANRFFGSVNIWINNATIDQDSVLLADHKRNNIDCVIDTNIKGMVYGTKIAIKGMEKPGGIIYNIEGFGSNNTMKNKMSIYGMSKRALTYFTKSMSKEVRNSNVKICLISPGKVAKSFQTLSPVNEERVTLLLVEKILKNRKNGISIKYPITKKTLIKLLEQPLKKI